MNPIYNITVDASSGSIIDLVDIKNSNYFLATGNTNSYGVCAASFSKTNFT